ncbi:aminotransferase class III-fold pyridoxal phosphate-dependent enzyme [Methylophaga sp.]|uniref:aminotransferase class III-fold pyridoxal phosphate-dependent enzyme n=1 Tax=Methylophaga sp. TaxID=2024840 RepID=UPI0027191928|nr:aminotransferase class III-fold pyridoxal phosphate-dependent enzyme [Methylophaga sp.]MDO8827556.1 aminotransferase class III-fold pyridoxal phosphate-dependent enzyme [Methylophaga sp.]
MAGLYNNEYLQQLAEQIKSLLIHWNIDEDANVSLLTVSENATYMVSDEKQMQRFIIRVHRPEYHSKQEIHSELLWIQSLREQALLNTPEPLTMRDGSLIASFKDNGVERYLVAFEFMPGKQPDEDESLIQGFEILGATSARLHQQARQWSLPEGFNRKKWNFDSAFGANPLWGDWREAPGLDEEGQAILEQLCDVLEAKLDHYGESPDRFGLVHADLRLANLLVDDKQLSVIDFDDCGFSWFIYDFASAVSFLETSPLLPELQRAWVRGYKSIAPLSAEGEAMISTLVMFRRLLLTAWVASHPETETAAEAGFEQFTFGTIELAKNYLKQQHQDSDDVLTEKRILDMNAFEASSSSHPQNVMRRLNNVGSASVLFYQEPIEMLSAQGAWMYAADGKRYLDFYNNVPCLGHCHPSVVQAVYRQLATLNVHTRYLVSVVDEYLESLKATLPASIANIVMTCSGSEANDLAMRLAKQASGGQGFIVTEDAYHGNTSLVTEVSPSIIKQGKLPDYVVAIPAPSSNVYGQDIETGFALKVSEAIELLQQRGYKVAGLLVDTIFSSDGIYTEPRGFLKQAVDVVHKAGGVFIADEVQPGFARLGETFWGFDFHGVMPDIVTMGKPMGNGFPMAAVATRPDYLASFCADVGYFNTFGGNPVAAAAGQAVLDTIQQEHLQANALVMGHYLKTQLHSIAEQSANVAEVRGQGLFIGIDIGKTDNKHIPDPLKTKQIINGLKAAGVLIGAAGRFGATLKLRPLLTLTQSEADFFLEAFSQQV